MSIIAWDGKHIAADRQITTGEIISRGCKLKRLKNGIIAGWIGNHGGGRLAVQWYKDGADFDNWPKSQDAEDWAHLIVCTSVGLYHTDSLPCWFKIREKFAAFGAGKDIALGAMAAGATAIEAVKIANTYCISCGLGVDSFPVPKRTKTAD